MGLRSATDALDYGECFFVGASDQDVVARILVAKHSAHDVGDMRRRLPLPENHFGIALAQGAVMVHFGDTDVFEGHMFQALDTGFGREFAFAHGFQKLQNFFGVHFD